jgi:hypothetical protein
MGLFGSFRSCWGGTAVAGNLDHQSRNRAVTNQLNQNVFIKSTRFSGLATGCVMTSPPCFVSIREPQLFVLLSDSRSGRPKFDSHRIFIFYSAGESAPAGIAALVHALSDPVSLRAGVPGKSRGRSLTNTLISTNLASCQARICFRTRPRSSCEIAVSVFTFSVPRVPWRGASTTHCAPSN